MKRFSTFYFPAFVMHTRAFEQHKSKYRKAMLKFVLMLIPLVLLTLLIIRCSGQKEVSFTEYKAKFGEEFREELEANKVIGASYAVFSNDSVIWCDKTGFSDLKKMTSAAFTTRYNIGSVTKVFTAIAILQLSERGLINLDAPVTDYVKDFAIRQRFSESGPITIRSVLTHHAGLPGDIFYRKFTDNPPPFTDVLHYLNTQYTTFPVGKIKSYSNLGYALLGVVIERVSGISYIDYIQQNIFNPIAMRNSGFYVSMAKQPELSVAYNKAGEEAKELPIFDIPAGGIYSTVEDMVKFGQSFLCDSSAILRQKTLKQMFELQNKNVLLDLDNKSAICFDFKNKAQELGRVFEHGGATIYHRAQLYIAPDSKMGAIMLSNSPNGTQNAWKLNEQFMVEYKNRTSRKADAHSIPEKQVNYTSINKKNMQSFTGDYAMPGMVCNFSWKHDNILASVQGNTFYILPEDDHSFVPAKRFLGFMFRSKKMYFFLEEMEGQKLFIRIQPWGELSIIGTRIERKPFAEIWETRIGKYSISNQSKTDFLPINSVEIVEQNGFLILKYKFNDALDASTPEMALDIKNGNEASISGLGRGGGESVIFRTTTGSEKPAFTYSGLEFTLDTK